MLHVAGFLLRNIDGTFATVRIKKNPETKLRVLPAKGAKPADVILRLIENEFIRRVFQIVFDEYHVSTGLHVLETDLLHIIFMHYFFEYLLAMYIQDADG